MGVRHGPALAGFPAGSFDGCGLALAGGLHFYTARTGRQPAVGVGDTTAARLFVESGCKLVGDSGILCGFHGCALGPAVWIAVIFLGMGLLQPGLRRSLVFASLAIPAAFLLHDGSTPQRFTTWTPYQTIDYERLNFPDGEFWKAIIEVNHTGYQFMVDLSPDFLQHHPESAQLKRPIGIPTTFRSLLRLRRRVC